MKTRFHLLVWISLLLLPLSGCKSTELKAKAVKVVATLGTDVAARDEAQRKALEQSIAQVLRIHRAALRIEWRAKESELRLRLYQESAEQTEAIVKRLNDQLERELTPVLKRITDDQAADRAKGGERDTALALQLAATLTAAHQESAKLEIGARRDMVAAREKLEREIADAFKLPPELIDGDDSATVAAILQPLADDGKVFKDSIEKAAASLTGFINQPHPVESFARGFLGEGFYAKIAPALNDRLAGFTRQAETLAQRAIKLAEDKLKTIAKA